MFATLLTLLTSCGYVGEPLPPALNIPVPVVDLRAAEIGASIAIQFTLPQQTTEGLPIKDLRAVEIAVGESPAPFSQDVWAAQAKHYPVPSSEPAVTTDLPAADWTGKTIAIASRTTGAKGKTSAWSNFVTLNIIPPVAAPTALTAENTEHGVTVTWQGSAAKYRVFRAAGETKPVPLADTDKSPYVDESTAYGTRYQYLVQALVSDTQQSVVIGPVSVTPKDEFPPAVPSGVNGVATGSAIELAWERNTEEDFASYSIYRSVEGAPFERIAAVLQAPAFSDTRIESGKRYRYQVTALDATGNESARSPITEVIAQ